MLAHLSWRCLDEDGLYSLVPPQPHLSFERARPGFVAVLRVQTTSFVGGLTSDPGFSAAMLVQEDFERPLQAWDQLQMQQAGCLPFGYFCSAPCPVNDFAACCHCWMMPVE